MKQGFGICEITGVLRAVLHTHGEADDLVVSRRLRFLHRLHEWPGVLVTLQHDKTIW